MTLHGYALTSDGSAQLAAIRDRHRTPFPGGGVWWYEIDRLLGWHDRLASLLAERESEIDRLRAELAAVKCDGCGGDGYFKGPRIGDEPCHKCGGTGKPLAAVKGSQ